MTVYGGPRPTPPRIKPDPLLFGAFGFLVVAVVVGLVLAFQGGGGGGPSAADQQTAVPQQPAATSAAPPPPPSSAPPSPTPSPTPPKGLVPAKPSMLRAAHSGMCLQADEGNGGNAKQVPCDGNPTQLWVPQAVTQDVFKFVNVKDNRCLDVNGASKDNGAQILQWDCHDGINQKWRLQRDNDGFRFVSMNSGKCIGIDSGSPDPGAPAHQWDCDGSANQRWQLPT